VSSGLFTAHAIVQPFVAHATKGCTVALVLLAGLVRAERRAHRPPPESGCCKRCFEASEKDERGGGSGGSKCWLYVGVGIGIERPDMGFGHEKLDVYRAAIDYVRWAYRFREGLQGQGNATAEQNAGMLFMRNRVRPIPR
jgi:hypothetical protein